MKFLILVICSVSAFAIENFDGPEYAAIDASTIIPIQEMPGFWDDRDFPESFKFINTRVRRIVGGDEAVPNSIPWQVALIITVGGGTALCGGSVLSTNAVLTAAHCPSKSRGIVVIAGAHDRTITEPNQQRRSVSTSGYRVHADYNSRTLVNDIAILLVPTPWTINSYVQSTRLPIDFTSELFVNEIATVSGWGRTTNTGSVSNVLRFAAVPVTTNAACIAYFGSSFVSTMLCVNTDSGKGSCSGDSGGPLTIPRAGDARPIQVGIVSFGASAGCVGVAPAGFTRVTSYINWIGQYVTI